MDEEKDQQVGQASQPDSQDLPPSPAKRGDLSLIHILKQKRAACWFPGRRLSF